MKRNTSFLTGTMISAGTAIGAGMFSIPIVASGSWFWWGIAGLFFLWFLNYLCSIYLLEVNLHFEPGASFDSIAGKLLGPFWNTLVGLGVAFTLYILMYAYYSAFGSFVNNTFNGLAGSMVPRILSLIIGIGLGGIVWFSTGAVGRISSILVTGMVVTFLLSMGGFSLTISWDNLLDPGGEGYFKYIWAALPYFMTSFAFMTVVPSLYKFYGPNPAIIRKGLLTGSLLAFAVFVFFMFVVYGNISRDLFIPINLKGGNIGDLVSAIQSDKSSLIVNKSISLFSNFAIISSFLGVGLSLFDYIADRFSFGDSRKGRLYSGLITFLPPGIASFFFPNGFITAIGFAGLVVVFSVFISIFFMVSKSRKKNSHDIYKVKGGQGLMYFFFAGSLLIAACQILGMLGYLPRW